MMHQMMPGMDIYFSFWLSVILLVILLIVITLAWLIAHWLKNRQSLATVQSLQQPQDSYKEYAEGYQAQTPDTFEEGEERYLYPMLQDEQPKAQYPQAMPPLHLHSTG